MQESPAELPHTELPHMPRTGQRPFLKRRWISVGFGVLAAIILVAAVVYAIHALTKKSGQDKPKNTQNNQSQQSGGYQPPSGTSFKALAACSSQPPLTTVPTTLSDYQQIVPLGNIGVPDHTIPTDHLYFGFKEQGGGSNLVAPGNIVVTAIMNSGETHTDGKGTNTNDYALTFYACKGVYFVLGHVETLSGPLAAAVKDQKWDRPCDRHNPAPGEETFYCNKTIDIALKSGESIGTVGGKVGLGAFDFGAHKVDYVDPGFIRPERYPNVDAVCGLDYFTPDAKAALFTKVPRTTEPRCGQIGQDARGTAQGDWFSTQNLQQGMSDWSTNLSLAHDNIDPSIGIVGVAGQIGGAPATYRYHPTTSGIMNLQPSQLKPGSTTYCYSDNATDISHGGTAPSGKILIQLIDASTMKVEHQDGACGASEQLHSSTTYYR
jgi:hypothetical protein